MRKLFTLVLAMVAASLIWAQSAERDEFSFGYDRQTESSVLLNSESLKTVTHSETNPGGGIPSQNSAVDKIRRVAPKAQAASQNGGTHLGYVTKDKLKYAVFQFDGATTPVATLVGWVDSYDYTPNIVVPDNVTFNGASVPVTTIDNYAFINGWGITGLTLGKNVMYIGIQAFAGCNISNLSIPVSVHQIALSAFDSCALTSVTFEQASSTENPLIIGLDAFSYTQFQSIELPARLALFKDYSFRKYYNNPFRGNNSLKSITVNPNFNSVNRNYTLEINQGALCERHTNNNDEYFYIISYPAGLSQNEFNVTEDYIDVCDCAFSYCKINNISLTSTREPREGKVNMVIGNNAFEFSDIQSLNIGANGRIRLSDYFSNGCRQLKSYNLSDAITNFKVFDGAIYAKKNGERYLVSYPCGQTDASVTIPSDVLHLATGCFNSNPYVTEVTLPSELKTIGYAAFRNCTNLERLIYTGNSIESIGEYAFMNSKISFSTTGEVTLGNWLIGYGGEMPANLVISENIHNAASGVFQFNENITSVTFPMYFENIPARMFEGCSKLNSVLFSQNLRTIGEYAFSQTGLVDPIASGPQSRSTSSLIIPEGVTTIGDYAFAYSGIADKLIIPSTIENVGERAFHTNNIIREVEIHRSTPTTFDNEDAAGYIFKLDTYENGTLIIPKEADPLAFSQYYWWNFNNIINGEFASVENIEFDSDKIIVSNGSITSTNGEIITLYNSAGQLIGAGKSFSNLSPGIYIIRLGSDVAKYIIR